MLQLNGDVLEGGGDLFSGIFKKKIKQKYFLLNLGFELNFYSFLNFLKENELNFAKVVI